eukprot:857711_1
MYVTVCAVGDIACENRRCWNLADVPRCIEENPKWNYITKHYAGESGMSLRCDFVVKLQPQSMLLRRARLCMKAMFGEINIEANRNDEAMVDMNTNNAMEEINVGMNYIDDTFGDNGDGDLSSCPSNLDLLAEK